MSQELYSARRAVLIVQDPSLASRLPEEWPLAVVETSRFTFMEHYHRQSSEWLVIGASSFDELASTVFVNDTGTQAVVPERHINVLVLPAELLLFAKRLGDALFYDRPYISYSFPKTAHEVVLLLHRLYGTAGQAAALGGLTLLASHSLIAEAEPQRAEWLPLIHATLASRMSSLGNAPPDAWLGAKHALLNGVTLYARPRFDMLKGLYAGKSAICIASGPSLTKHLDHIKAVQHEHIIIATDSVYKGLLAQGIFPDFVTVVERTDDMHRLFDGTEWKSEGTWCVAVPLVHPSTVTTFRHRVIWWWNKDALYPWIDPQLETSYSGRSAGTMTVALAGWLGVTSAYLAGHDLAYGEDGTTHTPTVAEFTQSETLSYEKGVEAQNAGDKLAPTFRHQQHRVPGNAIGKDVLTNGTWLLFKSDIEAIVAAFPHTVFYNINSECGARINGTASAALPPATGEVLPRIGRHQHVSGMRWTVYWTKVRNLLSDLTHFSKESQKALHWLSKLDIKNVDEATMTQVAERTTITSLLGPDRSSPLTDNLHFFSFIFCPSYNCYLLECHKQAKESTQVVERRYKVIRESIRLMEIFSVLSCRYASEVSDIVEGVFNVPAAHMKDRRAAIEALRTQEKSP